MSMRPTWLLMLLPSLCAWGCSDHGSSQASTAASGGSAGIEGTGGAPDASPAGATGGSGPSDAAVDCATVGPNCITITGTIRDGIPLSMSCIGESAAPSRLLGDAPAWWMTCHGSDGMMFDLQLPVQQAGTVAHSYDASSPTQAFGLASTATDGSEVRANPRSQNFVSAAIAGTIVQRLDGQLELTATADGQWAEPSDTCRDSLMRVDCLAAQLHVSVCGLLP
jgi:hypothetical protein